MNYKVKNIITILLTIGSCLGVGASVGLAIHDTKRSKDEFTKVSWKDNKKLYLKTVIKYYWPTALTTTATIASIVTNTILNKKAEASLIATAIAADASFKKYKSKAEKLIGEENIKKLKDEFAKDDLTQEVEENIEVDPHEGKQLYYMERIGYFWSKPELIQKAYAEINRKLMYDGYSGGVSMVSDFFDTCEAEFVNETSKNASLYKDYGWTDDYLSEGYDKIWIDIEERETEINGKKFIDIGFRQDPILTPMLYDPDYMEEYVRDVLPRVSGENGWNRFEDENCEDPDDENCKHDFKVR